MASLATLTVLAGSIGWIELPRPGWRVPAELTADLQSAVEESQRLQKEGKRPQRCWQQPGAPRPCCMPVPPIRVAERVEGLLSNLAETAGRRCLAREP